MSTARQDHIAALLPSGQVLVAGGYNIDNGNLASAELYDPATKSFLPAIAMSTTRWNHAATLLPSGQVLVAGGVLNAVSLASAELYDPAGRWAAADSMRAGRVHATATRMSNHHVLVAGGTSAAGYEASAELYDPAMGSFTSTCANDDAPPTCAMSTARASHTATLLLDDQVLVAGGISKTGYETSVERYDPATKTWTPATAMHGDRAYHVAVELDTGRVLVAGGWGTTGIRQDAELYDPTTNTWALIDSMNEARWQVTATLLSNGQVLVAGGNGTRGPRSDAELYDPQNSTWTLVPAAMSSPRTGHTATLLPNGRVLLAGGAGQNGALASADLFDPASKIFTPVAPMLDARMGHVATLLPDGRVLVAGGADTGGPLAGAEIYDPAKNAWQQVRSLITPRSEPVGAALQDGRVLLVGGLGEGFIPLATAERYELFSNGTLCGRPTDCQSGFCVDGVCCNTACAAGPCDVCSVSTEITPLGGQTAGTCTLLTGPTCDDGDLCTQTDVCQSGVCTGQDPTLCAMPDPCHKQDACNPKTGVCPLPVNTDDNTPCDDGNDCTTEDRCQAGGCTGTKDVRCACPECVPYVCFGLSRSCKTSCDSVNDCASGYVCDPTHHCVPPPPDMHTVDNSGCALAPPGAPAHSPWKPWALSLLALGTLGARRLGSAPTRRRAGALPRAPRGLSAPRPGPGQALDSGWKNCAMRSSSHRPVQDQEGALPAGDGHVAC
ncbi:hypothetical protein KEG38_51020 [Polyangium jinanense]|uniref:Kelch repeat-containing protein n=1 Tax=Polyangium jinanense TaxID=2829994 RepID=UPI0023403BB2|nr:kelch repeat-containing protein [Polyangium jinanense]MDC3962254.1 hypothetical protein [Polyangium jinanense]